MVIRPTDYELDFVNFDRSPIEKLNEISGRRVVEIQARETKSGKVIATTKASVVIDIEANVLVARKQLTSMTLIEHQDLEFRWLPLTKAKLNDQQSIASVVGRAPKQTIQTGQQIRLKNLILPAIVGRGQMVRLRMLRANGIEVNAEAKAMSAGSIGENVKVYYAATKKTLSATVTGAGQVEVRL